MKDKTAREKNLCFLKTLVKILLYIVIALFITLFGTILYLGNTWKDLTYLEIVFHLKTSISGTSPEMIRSALLCYALPALLVFIAIVVLLEIARKKNNRIFKIALPAVLICLLILNGINLYIFNKNTKVISDFLNAITRSSDDDFVKDIYIAPETVPMEFPEKKRNLIYIYLESMETTFADISNGGGFTENYIPNLTELSEENENFQDDSKTLNGGIALPGTNWTSAALFAQTCGLPLELPIEENQVNNSDEFFPMITTMGDILEDQGYTNVVELGSSADFAGVRAYYTKHGNYKIHDYNYAIKKGLIPKDYYEFWGYEDRKLFDFAKADLTELAEKGKPFNYTMFTIDTHFEDGYVCPLCEDKYGDNQYANVISCSDRQVTDFIKWIQSQDFYDNTTIVLTGDHPTMDADFCENVASDYQRKTYTCFINSAAERQIKTHREYSTLDLFPTMLASLGVKLSSDQLGCGTNLYGTEQTIIEKYGKDVCEAEFAKGSLFVESLTKIKVDDKAIESARNDSYLEVAEENGNIRFRLIKGDYINYLNMSDLTLVVHDRTTGEEQEYEMEIDRVRSGWHGIVHSDIPFDKVSVIDCDVYVTVDDYGHFLLKSYPAEELGMWDIKWDKD